MKREQIILQQLNPTQLGIVKRMVDNEVRRRSSAPPKRGGNRARSRSSARPKAASAS